DAWGGSADKDRNLILSHLYVKATSSSTPAPTPTEPAPSEPAPTDPAPTDPVQPIDGEAINTTYTVSSENFGNPERGWNSNKIFSNDLSGHDFNELRSGNRTLVRGVFDMKELSGPLSQSSLDNLDKNLQKTRDAGLKAILTFRYNDPNNGDGSIQTSKDAPLNIVKQHLDQLKPIFEKHADVLMGLRGGFVGAWGEWHNSSNSLDKEPARSEVHKKILEVLPKDRMMSVRRVEQVQGVTAQDANATIAFNQSNDARTGMTDNCFLASPGDGSTFAVDGKLSTEGIEAQKNYLADVSKFLFIGGETCGNDISSASDQRDDCNTAREELKRFHYTYLNSEYSEETLGAWRSQGCFDEFGKYMGYRFELKSSSIQKTVKAGATLNLNFVVKNVGYASPVNPRSLAIVLRNQSTGTTYTMNILQDRSSTLDPRFWFRESGDITVAASPTLPSTVPAGTYDVLLSLPDPKSSLANRPEYSIRMANTNVWEASTGLNLLAKGLTVTQ
ncbi:MAG: DUF4832 domain-containing protein, partial [Trueperaceae bacterium]